MISNRTFIVFSDDWGRHPSSCQHLMTQFLHKNQILWINSIGLRSPQFSFYDFLRALEVLKRWTKPLVHIEKNLWVFSPFSLPWNRIPAIRRWNKKIAIRQIKRVIGKIGLKRIVSLTTDPNICDWIGELGEDLKIYYCVDDFSEWPGMNRELILEMETKLLLKIDLFLATSQRLFDIKKPTDKPALLIPHGVDVQHFKKAYNEGGFHSQKVPPLSIAYFGVIDERLDYDLIHYLVQKRPKWTWVFLGPLITCPKELRKEQNFRFIPPVSYSKLPEALRSYNLLILPYKLNQLTESINPLKLRECLATGKLVVSSDIPEVRVFSDIVKIGKTKEDFLNILDVFAGGKERPDPHKQWERLKGETWQSRAEKLSNKIQELLETP